MTEKCGRPTKKTRQRRRASHRWRRASCTSEHEDAAVDVEGLNVVGQGVSVGPQPVKMRTATPERGQHNDEILRELGLGEAEISGLRERKVI